MNVLMISLDPTLAENKAKVVGDSQKRHIQYGKYLKNLFIIVPSKNKTSKIKLSKNVFVYPVKSRPGFMINACFTASRICRDCQIDIVTTQDPFFTGLVGYLIKRKLKIPLNVQVHNDFIDNKYWQREAKINQCLNILGKKIITRADSVRVVSSEIKQKLLKYGKAADIKVIPIGGGIIVSDFTIISGRKIRNNILKKKFKNIALFAGRLVKQKNIPNLFAAISQITFRRRDTVFVIAGSGPEQAYLNQQAKTLGVSDFVHFTGPIKYPTLAQYFKACDLFVLPSNYEGMARVLIEAAAAAKPIVATKVSGSSAIVKNNLTGYLVPINRPQPLAKALEKILRNPALAQTMGKEARKIAAKRFDRQNSLKPLIQLWQKTICQS